MVQILQSIFFQGEDQVREDFTPSVAVVCGEVVDLGNKIGCVTSPEGVAANVLGSIATRGCFKLAKGVSVGVTFAKGAPVRFDLSTNLAVTSGGVPAGHAYSAAANGDDHVKCWINEPPPALIDTTTTTTTTGA